ncbi:hypothetical protein K449DRAFT_431212 [Hypoxylon sp. EC38]|nr:hypothetical protein K449DRAFT_431212 [Hypoxylon sp. EC38]
MAPVTEFVQSTLKPGIPLEPLYKAFEKVKAASGNRVVRASPLHDNPEQFRLFIDWDSIDAHLAFRTTDAYKDFMSEIAPYVAGPAVVVHLDLTPFPPTVLDKSPVTEVFQMYFDPSADEAKNLAAAKKDVEHKGEKTRVLTALIGWESVEAHTAALESDAFKKITSYFQTGTDGIKGYDMSYVSLKAI